MENIFETARLCINEGLIRQYFDCEKSKVKNGRTGRELMTLCPFRNDTKPGSFFVNLDNGMWIEKSTSSGESEGDFIKLVSLTYNLSIKEAAEKIVHDAGMLPPEPPKKKKNKKEKPKPVIPIPSEELIKKLDDHIASKWIVERWGTAKYGWKYRNKNGEIWMCVVRHENDDNGKEMIPYYYGEDQKWHAGMPIKKNRPLYGIDRVEAAAKKGEKNLKLLIVEGEKCADIPVEGYILLTWSGGVGQIKQTDWESLLDYSNYIDSITFWPDYDQEVDKDTGEILPPEKQAGLEAAIYVHSQLPGVKILDVYSDPDYPPKWDIADAYTDGIDLIDFIQKKKFMSL